jgi:orotate phosphoribosyltransferase
VSTAVLDQEQVSLKPTYSTLAEFIRKYAIQQGSFVLASNVASDYYCDGKQVSFRGEGLALVVEAILDDLKDLEFDAIGGMDMGATPIVSALALRYFQLGRDVPTFVVRKDVKHHGTMKKIEGPIPDPPCRVVVIDDVVTSGGSILQAIQAIRDHGSEIVRAISVLDREEGGAKRLHDEGISYRPLVTTSQLGIANGARQTSSPDCTE